MSVRILAEPKEDDFARQLDHAVRAERAGFEGWFRSEHYVMGEQAIAGTDALLTLAGIARETARLRLGTLVSPATFRLPGVLAVQVAQLDHMSGGRIELGLGAGWHGPEHRALGLDFGSSMAERFERLEEQLEVVRRLWVAQPGERVAFAGSHYRLVDVPAIPTVQRPHVPLIIGGQGRVKTPRPAAAHASEFNALRQPPEDLPAVYGRVREACEAIGRDPATMMYSAAVVVCCGTDRAEVDRRIAAAGQRPEKLTVSGAFGSPDEVAASLLRYLAAGADRLYVRLFDLSDLDHLDLVAEEVLPQLAASGGTAGLP